MNVYVHPDLRRRMREYNAVINWSQVAAEAFEAAMTKHDERVEARLRRYNRHYKKLQRNGEHT